MLLEQKLGLGNTLKVLGHSLNAIRDTKFPVLKVSVNQMGPGVQVTHVFS